ncbi:MAG TPA: VCBS repeat-containing protein [Myxococcales bacterium]|nr:VCBS repeat-containing protein [Myxococcales bacterium]
MAYYERARFEYDKPVRIRAIKIMVEIKQAGLLTAYVWDDWGGNFISLVKDEPLAVLKKQVSPSDSGTWIEMPIVPTLELDPGHLVYAGLIVNGKDGIRLMSDGEQEKVEGMPGKSIVWLSKEVDKDFGGNTVYSLAKGDFMVRLETQNFDVVAEEDLLFEPIDSEVTGIPSLSRGGFADYDNDGDLDLMLSGRGLFKNSGDGTFIDVSEEALPPGFSCNGGVWGDFDNDGDPDWFGTGKNDVLLRNDDGVFVDVTVESGIDDTQQFVCEGESGLMNVPTESAAWIDVDGDGYLDLYQGNFICWTEGMPSLDILWHNNGDGSFTDISAESGIKFGQFGGQAARGMAPADYNNDGHMDLLVTDYRLHRNMHWKNNGDGTMTNVGKYSKLEGNMDATGGMFAYGHSIGASWGDFDLDGYLDVFIANLAHPRFFTFSDKQTLYLNDGAADPRFLDMTQRVILAQFDRTITANEDLVIGYDTGGLG